MWKTISSKEVFNHPRLSLLEDEIILPNGVKTKYLKYKDDGRCAVTIIAKRRDGKKTEYFNELLEKYNNDHTPAGIDWLENQGVLTTEDGKEIQGPNPTQVAKEYLGSLKRLREFASKHTDRPIIIGGVGHQWDLDAVVTYLARAVRM